MKSAEIKAQSNDIYKTDRIQIAKMAARNEYLENAFECHGYLYLVCFIDPNKFVGKCINMDLYTEDWWIWKRLYVFNVKPNGYILVDGATVCSFRCSMCELLKWVENINNFLIMIDMRWCLEKI